MARSDSLKRLAGLLSLHLIDAFDAVYRVGRFVAASVDFRSIRFAADSEQTGSLRQIEISDEQSRLPVRLKSE